jgi:hypothetical protein
MSSIVDAYLVGFGSGAIATAIAVATVLWFGLTDHEYRPRFMAIVKRIAGAPDA